MNIFVILLRGVMPTGKNKVPMAELRAALTKVGLKGVQTYIQSGNVIALSDLSQLELEQLVRQVIQKNFGGDIAVFARTAAHFLDILKKNPFTDADTKRLYFTLLADKPVDTLLKTFIITDFSSEKIQVVDTTIYTLYATKYSDSKFNNTYFERKLRVAATTRNFNTMTKLAALSAG